EGKCRPAGERYEGGVGERRAVQAAEGVQENGVYERRRSLASRTVCQRYEVVPKAGPTPPERLDPLKGGGFPAARGLARMLPVVALHDPSPGTRLRAAPA